MIFFILVGGSSRTTGDLIKPKKSSKKARKKGKKGSKPATMERYQRKEVEKQTKNQKKLAESKVGGIGPEAPFNKAGRWIVTGQ